MEVIVEDWNTLEKNDLDITPENIKMSKWYLSRKPSTTDSFAWIKIKSKLPFEKLKISKLIIQSNARFVELYYIQETTVEYLTTLRGGTGSDKFVFEIEHSGPLQFNQLHLKFLSIKNHSVDQVPGSFELKIKNIEMTLAQSAYDVASTKYVSRNAGGIRSDSGASVKSDNSGTTTETRTTPSPIPGQVAVDHVPSTDGPNNNNNNQAQQQTPIVGGSQRMDPRQMILLGMNKPPQPPPINLSAASPEANGMIIQLMLQMKTSLLSDIGGLLDTKLLPIVNRLDKLESTVNELKNKLNNNSSDEMSKLSSS